MAQIDQAFDPDERPRLVREASLLVIQDWTMTPLFNIDTIWAVNPETVDVDSWEAKAGHPFLSRTYESLRPKN